MKHQYFQILQQDLAKYGQGYPQLIVDKEKLLQNLAQVKTLFKDQIYPRLVVKSLANIELLKLINQTLNTQRFMVFHLPQIIEILKNFEGADLLLGKPIPIQAVRNFYQHYPQYKNAHIQWLIDSPQQLQKYLEMAQQLNLKLKINIEIDVGLHRGGVQSEADFLMLLKMIKQHQECLIFSGLMGYDAHVAKLPAWLKKIEDAYRESQGIYETYQQLILKHYPELWHDQLCFNGGGSPTLTLHAKKSVCNDVAFGSVLLKPSDFDLAVLESFQAALWIASPVLKVLSTVQIPALEVLNKLPFKQQAIFIYGGYWLAKYEYPKGLKPNLLYGRSTNQEMLTLPQNTPIKVDDYIIARPTQSEAVLPQFQYLYWYERHQFDTTINMRE